MKKTAIPAATGLLHFTGIGGIGMSGIAEILHNLGYRVRGSDLSDNANVKRLRQLGISVTIGQTAANVEGAAFVVISSAVKPDNAEYRAARKLGIPIVRRAEMLAELARLKWSVAVAGTHGKTTTTTLVATLLETAGLDPTVVNGGIISAWGSNARSGEGEWMVMEADESDGTFLRLHPTIGVVTNIDPEHLDYYGSFEQLQKAFVEFVHSLPFYGCAVVCRDHPVVRNLLPQMADRKLVTYGLADGADLTARNIRIEDDRTVFDVVLKDREIEDVRLSLIGDHNVGNALAAVGVGLHLGLSDDVIRRGLNNFAGVGRRFTRVGVINGVTVIDDYGHHPTEIQAVLQAARMVCAGRIIAVVQPHRYSRLSALWTEFARCVDMADTVLLTPVYAAGESPLPGIGSQQLAKAMRDNGHPDVMALETIGQMVETVQGIANPGDYVICLGAGDITTYAHLLPDALAALHRKTAALTA